jgi:uncharacterized protein YbaR (Trm112 family)
MSGPSSIERLPADLPLTAPCHSSADLLPMDSKLLDILACPICKGPLQYHPVQQLLVCRPDRLAYPIRDGIPIMLEDEARPLTPDDALLKD